MLAHGGRFTSPDWDFWFEILGRHADRGTREPTLPPLAPIEDHEAAFHAAGLTDVRAAEVEIAVEVDEPSAFLLGEQTHGARSFFDRFEPDGACSGVSRRAARRRVAGSDEFAPRTTSELA